MEIIDVPADQLIDDYAFSLGLGNAIVQSDPAAHISRLRDTVIEELAMALENQGMPVHHMQQWCEKTARALGLEDLLEHRPAELSGGQMRRLAIGCVAIAQPDTLILCEPYSGLDMHSQELVERYLKELSIGQNGIGTRCIVLTQRNHSAIPQCVPEAVQPQEELLLPQVSSSSRRYAVGPYDLPLRRGGVLWLRGHNGTGKTSLLRALAGLDKHRPAHSSISLAMQSPVDQVTQSTVHKFLGAGIEFFSSETGMAHLFDMHPLDISYSSLRLAQVASVCAQGRDIVLLDEPDTLLSIGDRPELHRILALTVKRGAALLITCHDPAFIEEIRCYASVSEQWLVSEYTVE